MPRAIGVQAALDLIISGEPVKLERAQQLALIDRVVEDLEAALDFARELLAAKAPPRRLRDQPIPDANLATAEFFAAYRKALPRAVRKLDAAERIIRCAEAAVTSSFEEALALSRILFEECRKSTASAALRHLFFAERGSRGPTTEKARPVARVCVLGAGTMGSGIAVSCATGGLDVTLIDVQPAGLAAGIARVHSDDRRGGPERPPVRRRRRRRQGARTTRGRPRCRPRSRSGDRGRV